MKTLFSCLALLAASTITRAAEPPLSPAQYLDLHHKASAPESESWSGAMEKLAKSGDGFTAAHLKELLKQKLDAKQTALINSTIEMVQKRAAAETDEAFAKTIQLRLERAALADMCCDVLEGTLVSWTLKSINEHIKRPGVAAELKRIETEYTAPAKDAGLLSAAQDRVRSYAKRISTATDSSKVGGATTR